MRLHERLDLRIGTPLLAVYLVSPNVEVLIGKKLRHLADEGIQEFVSCVFRRIHCWVEDSPVALDSIRPRRTRQLRITHKPRRAVSGHIELRDHTNPAIARISD